MSWFCFFSALILLGGCGNEPVMQLANSPIVPKTTLRSFPRENWRFVNNRMFLWWPGVTAEDAREALRIIRLIDEKDALALPLNRMVGVLDAEIGPLKDQERLLKRASLLAGGQMNLVGTKIQRAESELLLSEAKLAEEKLKPNPNAEILQSLAGTVSMLKGQLSTMNEWMQSIQKLKRAIDADLSKLQAELAPKVVEREELEEKRSRVEREARELISKMLTIVEWFESPPSSVVFQFSDDGELFVSMAGWDLNDGLGPRNFSTRGTPERPPTIVNANYEELGGVFTFEVRVFEKDALSARYSFKISRTRYDSPDGRRFFSGDIIRERSGEPTRRGMVKLVDRNS